MKLILNWIIVVVLATLLVACGGDDVVEDNSVAVAVALTQTAVVQTPDAEETAVSPPPILEPTPTIADTTESIAPAEPTAVAEIPSAPTLAIPDCVNDAEFIADITIPDNTEIAHESTFDKVWTIKNTGTCTWTNQYAPGYDEGDAELAAQSIVMNPVEVPPGSETEISVTFKAPYLAGSYISYWQMKSPAQDGFGGRFYLLIEVPQTDDNEPVTEVPGYGVVRGALAFPSEGIPAMTVLFQDVNDADVFFSLQTGEGWSAYENELPAGDYYVFARVTGDTSGFGGGYTAAVPCGLTAVCTDHSLLPVTIQEGQVIENIDATDWYAPVGTFPFP